MVMNADTWANTGKGHCKSIQSYSQLSSLSYDETFVEGYLNDKSFDMAVTVTNL